MTTVEGQGHLSLLKGWYHKPTGSKKVIIKEKENKLILRVPERTDCWNKTRQGLLQRTVNNIPFHWQKVSSEYDFQCIVKVSGNFSNDYDKAGIMIRQNDEHWIFTGIEYYNDTINHSTLVTNEYTDWTMAPLVNDQQPPDYNIEKNGIYLCYKKMGNVYECFHSYDSNKWIQTRQGLFETNISTTPALYVGIAAACPTGIEYKVTFDEYQCIVRTK